ncbi:MAG: metal ABC transporter permease [Chloroflexi bacterium]|nr:metal ABC transporter permease [Chloroflexota bacterium]
MADLVSWLLEPFEYAFMQRALMSLVIVSVVGSVVGTFVVHKGLAASGSGLAHATLAGVAIAFVNGVSIALGALVAAVASGVGIGYVRSNSRVSYDTAIAIFYVSAFSLGILIISRRSSYTPDLISFVFGDILGVSRADLVGELILAVVVVGFVLAFYREMVMVAYDPAMAAAAGVRAWFFEYALLVLIALAVVVALQAIGIVLVSAMLIIPPATASLLARRIPQIIAISFVLSVGASILGLYASFHADVAASPAIVLGSTLAFAVTLAATSRRGARLPVGAAE